VRWRRRGKEKTRKEKNTADNRRKAKAHWLGLNLHSIQKTRSESDIIAKGVNGKSTEAESNVTGLFGHFS
jgi:hypothetical protein